MSKRNRRTITLFSLALNLPVIALMVAAPQPPAIEMSVAAVMLALNGWLVYLARRERA